MRVRQGAAQNKNSPLKQTNHMTANWKEENNALYCKLEFKDFSQAFGFMARVALVAEQQQHHPKWTNVWNKVEIWLQTHDAGDVVTDKDRELAKGVDGILGEG
jgi:4a-hydroxytetrahydrobiopterin dehydratase